MAPSKKTEIFFQKMEEEANHYPVEYVRLTDGGDWWQGILLYDVRLSEARKNLLLTTVARLSGQSDRLKEKGLACKDSCQVSPEERAQLFSFIRSDNGAEK